MEFLNRWLTCPLYIAPLLPPTALSEQYLSPPCGESMRRLRHSLAGLQRYSADALDMRHGVSLTAQLYPSSRSSFSLTDIALISWVAHFSTER